MRSSSDRQRKSPHEAGSFAFENHPHLRGEVSAEALWGPASSASRTFDRNTPRFRGERWLIRPSVLKGPEKFSTR